MKMIFAQLLLIVTDHRLKGIEMYVIQNRVNLKYLSIECGTEWISSKFQATRFKFPETARSVRRSVLAVTFGKNERNEEREKRMLVVTRLSNE